jgi:thiol-disulfide isomerase/thioredoxin
VKALLRFAIFACILGVFGTCGLNRICAADTQISEQAKKLVRAVRGQEAWLDEIKSLSIRYEGLWRQSDRFLAKSRANLQRQFPDAELSAEQFPSLQPTTRDEGHLAFDRSRLRHTTHWENTMDRLHVWDGDSLFVHESYRRGKQEHYAFFSDPMHAGQNFWNYLNWPQVAPHSFWFRPQSKGEFYGASGGYYSAGPEDFEIIGERDYRGHGCYALQLADANFQRWYIGVEDNHLYGYMTGRLWSEPGTDAMLLQFASELAEKPVTNVHAWLQSIPLPERVEVERQWYKRVNELSAPAFEYALDDFKEVTPGGWIPMKQELFFYEGRDSEGIEVKPFVTTHKTLRLTDVKVDEELPKEWCEFEMKEGVRVVDQRHDPFLVYPHQKNRTQTEWDAIVKKAQQRNTGIETANRQMDAMIGRVAPEFPAESKWLNSDPLTWKSLEGKVVLIDFWADWCVPCRNDFPHLVALHKNREERGITVIGIHVAAGEHDPIQEVMDKFNMEYPICVDVPANVESYWGHLFAAYRVRGIPHSFVIDPDGKIVAHGQLGDSLEKAQELVRVRQN